jgi:hypothetical protein
MLDIVNETLVTVGEDPIAFDSDCRNHYECEAICPAEVSATFIARLNRDYPIAAAKRALAV